MCRKLPFGRESIILVCIAVQSSFHSVAELVQLYLYLLILGMIGLATRAVETNSRPPVVPTDPRQLGQAPGSHIGMGDFPGLRFGPDYRSLSHKSVRSSFLRLRTQPG